MQVINNSTNISITITNLLHEELSQFIQNFNKIGIKEIEPTTHNIYENICEEDFSIVIDELINDYSKMANNGKEERVRKKYVLDYMNNHRINLQEIYNWLLNNQNGSNYIYFLGYFNCNGIGTNINKQKALELYQKAVELKNNVAQYNLAKMYLIGDGVDQNHIKALELAKNLAEKGYLAGINMLGYCYDCGFGTNVNTQKALELYQKAANSGNIVAQYNIALMYEYGKGIGKDVNQAIYWYKKSAEQGDKYSKNKLKTLQKE
jgi:TPR repeat protein